MISPRMKLARSLLVLVCLWVTVFLIAGCGKATPVTSSPFLDGLNVKIYEKPAGSAKHEYDAVITDQNGKPATLDRVHLEITLSMNNMHHESEGDMKQTGDGQYAVKLKWAMDGDWKAAITLEKEKYKKTIRAAITPSS